MHHGSILRIGVIGAGTAGGRHARGITTLPEVRVSVVADPDATRGELLARDVGADYLPSVDDRFWAAVDAVIVCLPHAMLAAASLDVIARKKPVLIEKPLALSLDDIDAIDRAAASANVPVMIGFVHRFRSDALAVFNAIQRGVIGEPTFGVEHLISGGGPTPGWIWQREVAGGGVLLYNGVHGIDRLRWLLGRDVTHVYARTETRVHDADVEDIVVATLTFEGEVPVSFVQHIAPYPLPSGWRSEIYGTAGAVLMNADGSVTITDHRTTETMRADRDDRFARQDEAFVAAIRQGRAPIVTIADGRAALEIALAIYESARTGDVIAMNAATPA